MRSLQKLLSQFSLLEKGTFIFIVIEVKTLEWSSFSLSISNSSVNHVGSVFKNISRSVSKSVSHFYSTTLILGSLIPYSDYSNTLLTVCLLLSSPQQNLLSMVEWSFQNLKFDHVFVWIKSFCLPLEYTPCPNRSHSLHPWTHLSTFPVHSISATLASFLVIK